MPSFAFSMGKAKRNDDSVNKTAIHNPGPGAYAATPDKNLRYFASPSYSQGSAKRSDLTNKALRNVPGPNVYTMPTKVGEGPKFHMGSKSITGGIFVESKVPGPGTYAPIQVQQTRSASYSIKGKHKIGTQLVINAEGNHEKVVAGSDFAVPGPGTYSASTNKVFTNLSTKFGNEKRQSMSVKGSEKIPAPNAYDKDAKSVILTKAPAFGFGKSKRPASHDQRHIPGPGAYESKTIVGTESMGKSLGKRLGQPRTSNMLAPGPGTYNAKPEVSLTSNPGWKLGTSTRNDVDRQKLRTCDFPPPDNYKPDYKVLRTSSASWGFGSSKRDSSKATNLKTPAPGTYQIPAKIVEGPTYQMGLKLDNQSAIASKQKETKANPGPGQYTPNFFRTIKQDGVYTIKSRHDSKVISRAPGPGAYDPSVKPEQQAPSYGFGSEAQRKPLPEPTVPGPGNYHIPSSISNLPSYTGARSKEFGYI